MKFLPHLLVKPFPTALVITGTLLALVPAITMPAYSASKAALNAFIYCLRRQQQGSNTRIIEVWPPVVQSKLPPPSHIGLLPPNLGSSAKTAHQAELHDYMGPERGRNMGMPASEFIEKAWSQLATGSEHVIIGSAGSSDEAFLEIVKQRRQNFDSLSGILLGHFEL